MHTLLQYVCFQLHSQLGVDCSRSNLLDLDSSTPQKFSRHLVFHLPGAVFTTNIHTGMNAYFLTKHKQNEKLHWTPTHYIFMVEFVAVEQFTNSHPIIIICEVVEVSILTVRDHQLDYM